VPAGAPARPLRALPPPLHVLFRIRVSLNAKEQGVLGAVGKVDGCATFWKRAKFSMVENYDIEFNEVARRVAAELGDGI